jgi:hypothetical protein
MRTKHRGTVINVSSAVRWRATPGLLFYGMDPVKPANTIVDMADMKGSAEKIMAKRRVWGRIPLGKRRRVDDGA